MKYREEGIDTKVFQKKRGFSLLEVAVILVGMTVLIVAVFILLQKSRERAFHIIARHDLEAFVAMEKQYFKDHGEYFGQPGDLISNDPGVLSTANLEGFWPSEGVSVMIVSTSPLVVSARHKRTTSRIEYSFATGDYKER